MRKTIVFVLAILVTPIILFTFIFGIIVFSLEDFMIGRRTDWGILYRTSPLYEWTYWVTFEKSPL